MTKSSDQTRAAILEAAIETLRQEGFAGATSRAIAREGSFNQALIFYHFGSLDDLLVSALEQTSRRRLALYEERLAEASNVAELLQELRELNAEDRASGHITVVSQMVSGSLARPELGPRVLEQMEPWLELTERTIARMLPPFVPAADLAYAALSFYLGVNLLSTLDPDDRRLDALLEHAEALTPLLALISERG